MESCVLSEYNTMYYPYDLRMNNVVIHEYCHFLDDIYDILDKYKKQNFNKFFIKYINEKEEIAELLTIFVLNPYLLKILDLNRYKFFSNMFKPINPCSIESFFREYSKWSEHDKMVFRKIYKLKIDVKKKIIDVKKNNK